MNSRFPVRIGPRATLASIRAAQKAQQAERRLVEQAAGISITHDGRIIPPVTIVHCPRCGYAAKARREGSAVQSISNHMLRVHFPQPEES